MRIFIGMLFGLFVAVAIASAAGYFAFRNVGDLEDRDRADDVTREFDLAGFDALDLAGVYELNVTVGADHRVTVSGPPSRLDDLKASVREGTLHLDRESEIRGLKSFRRSGVTVEIAIPALRAVAAAGVIDGEVSGVNANRFEIELAGVGDLDVSGTCETLIADVSGVGDLDASDLKCQTVDVALSGVGDARVYASKAVTAQATGVGRITVYGSPATVDTEKTFLSRVTVK